MSANLDNLTLYAAHQKIYPRDIGGRFQRLRTAAVFWLLGMYYIFPWLNWNDRQMVLFDLPARKFYVFGFVLWPQDFIYLAAFLVICALSLFFFTALAGRLWCGYACPQTVWTEVFLWIERKIEGDRNARMRLDKQPWTWKKFRLKASKQAIWVLFSFWTGLTFIGFFTPIRDLALDFPNWHFTAWFWCLFYSGATYANAGFLREQVCKYMCPYARFQSAMFDKNTLIISYDEKRGEPRGSRKRGIPSVLERVSVETGNAEALAPALVALDRNHPPTPVGPPKASQLGDCIDCLACVQVCPTGIDIRNGLQYECIGCAACIDACDAVMDKMNYPRGLVRYATDNAIHGQPTKILRPRVIVYGLILCIIITLVTLSLFLRAPVHADILRDRRELYRFGDEGLIENAYQVKLINKRETPHRYSIRVLEPAGLQIDIAAEIRAPAGDVINVPMTLAAPEGQIRGGVDVLLEIRDLDQPAIIVREKTRFFAPAE
jgi:polyferredoxin